MCRTGDGKVVLITGAGRRRVGNVVAAMLAERGYAVVLHYHRSAAAAQETVAELAGRGGRAVALGADVTKEPEVDRLVEEALGSFGRLDGLVTTAAIWEPRALEEITAEDVRRQFEVNALGTFLCCRREGRPEHIGQAVIFLLENDFVTGVCLPVDGGRTIAGG